MPVDIFRRLPFYRIALPVFVGFILYGFFSETSMILNLCIYANIILYFFLLLASKKFYIVQLDFFLGLLLQLLLFLFFVKIKATQYHLKFSVQLLSKNVNENWPILISLFLPYYTVKSNLTRYNIALAAITFCFIFFRNIKIIFFLGLPILGIILIVPIVKGRINPKINFRYLYVFFLIVILLLLFLSFNANLNLADYINSNTNCYLIILLLSVWSYFMRYIRPSSFLFFLFFSDIELTRNLIEKIADL